MARLIEADALVEKMQARHDFFVDGWGGFDKMSFSTKCRVDEITNCIADIGDAPTVDAVEVVHSHWCWDGRFRACAKCGSYVELTETLGASFWKFCPFCGAKMDGGTEYV